MDCKDFIKTVERIMADFHIQKPMLWKTAVDFGGTPNYKASKSTVANMFQKKTALLTTQQAVVAVLKKLVGNLDWPSDLTICVRRLSAGEIPLPADKVNKMIEELSARIKSAPSRSEMLDCILKYPVEDEIRKFWSVINPLAKKLNIASIQAEVEQAGMPPGIPVQQGDTTGMVAEQILRHPAILSKARRAVWSLAVEAYPPRISGAAAPGVKDTARWLAKYWHYGVFEPAEAKCRSKKWKPILEDLGSACSKRWHEVLLLSWLELPLVTQTRIPQPGKIHLFRLGKWVERQWAVTK